MSDETIEAVSLGEVLSTAAEGRLSGVWYWLPTGFQRWTLATPVLIPPEDDDTLEQRGDLCCLYVDRIEGVVTTLASWHGETGQTARLVALKYFCEHDAFFPPPDPAPSR